MDKIEESISGAGGCSLFTRRFMVEGSMVGAVIVHGYAEYSDRYAHVAEYLTGLGFSCFLFDLRGHGRSEGPRGAILSWDDYLDDLSIFLDRATEWSGQYPQILLGHSLGGLIASSYTLEREHRYGYLVLSGPFFGLSIKVPAVKLILARVMSRVWPRLSLATEIDPATLSRDEKVGQDYWEDPLVHKVANSRFFTEALKAQESCLAGAGRLEAEGLLLMYGTDDKLTSTEASASFFEDVRIEDKTCIAYEDMYHEIFNEVGREGVLDDLGQWLTARIPG